MSDALDFVRIRALLPHGHPMILVDRIVAVVPGESIVGVKAISACEPCYAGLERDLPLTRYAYPSSMLLESFGQTAAILWLHSERLRGERRDGVLMFAVARNCVIEGQAFPGDVVRHDAKLEGTVGENLFVSGTSWVGERRIANIESMVAVLRPPASIGINPAGGINGG
jgi:3-hydroxyacyl-[acyl-carrier-protein] dehydratase